jgi:hypothetical protein
VLPRVLSHLSGDAVQVATALFRVYGDRVLPSAVFLIVLGIVIFVGALLMPRLSAGDPPSPKRRSPRRPSPPRSGSGGPDQNPITERLYL